MDIKPIETVYNGYRFRSRLEARWAVFFDALDVEYEYEPQGFKLQNGQYYLPDFKVKCHGTRGSRDGKGFDLYIEVKGKMTEADAKKCINFAGFSYTIEKGYTVVEEYYHTVNSLLIVGNIPPKGHSWDSSAVHAYDPMDGIDIYPFNYQLIDGDCFAAYPAAHNGKFYLWGDDSNYINRDDVEAVEKAYDISRQARFEHGETPIINNY